MKVHTSCKALLSPGPKSKVNLSLEDTFNFWHKAGEIFSDVTLNIFGGYRNCHFLNDKKEPCFLKEDTITNRTIVAFNNWFSCELPNSNNANYRVSTEEIKERCKQYFDFDYDSSVINQFLSMQTEGIWVDRRQAFNQIKNVPVEQFFYYLPLPSANVGDREQTCHHVIRTMLVNTFNGNPVEKQSIKQEFCIFIQNILNNVSFDENYLPTLQQYLGCFSSDWDVLRQALQKKIVNSGFIFRRNFVLYRNIDKPKRVHKGLIEKLENDSTISDFNINWTKDFLSYLESRLEQKYSLEIYAEAWALGYARILSHKSNQYNQFLNKLEYFEKLNSTKQLEKTNGYKLLKNFLEEQCKVTPNVLFKKSSINGLKDLWNTNVENFSENWKLLQKDNNVNRIGWYKLINYILINKKDISYEEIVGSFERILVEDKDKKLKLMLLGEGCYTPHFGTNSLPYGRIGLDDKGPYVDMLMLVKNNFTRQKCPLSYGRKSKTRGNRLVKHILNNPKHGNLSITLLPATDKWSKSNYSRFPIQINESLNVNQSEFKGKCILSVDFGIKNTGITVLNLCSDGAYKLHEDDKFDIVYQTCLNGILNQRERTKEEEELFLEFASDFNVKFDFSKYIEEYISRAVFILYKKRFIIEPLKVQKWFDKFYDEIFRKSCNIGGMSNTRLNYIDNLLNIARALISRGNKSSRMEEILDFLNRKKFNFRNNREKWIISNIRKLIEKFNVDTVVCEKLNLQTSNNKKRSKNIISSNFAVQRSIKMLKDLCLRKEIRLCEQYSAYSSVTNPFDNSTLKRYNVDHNGKQYIPNGGGDFVSIDGKQWSSDIVASIELFRRFCEQRRAVEKPLIRSQNLNPYS